MKKNFAFIFMVTLLLTLTGCSKEEAVSSDLSGTLKLGGSTTVYPVALKAGEVFMKNNPDLDIQLTQSSSGEGLEKFIAGDLDISDATRPPKDAEIEEASAKGMDLYMTEISNDAVVVVVNSANPVKDITLEQLDQIFFTGEISDWADITDGAKKGPINVYGTDPVNSGTAELFIGKIHKGGEFIASYEVLHPTPTVVPTIANDPDGIAYTPLKWVDSSVSLLSIGGIVPEKATILDTSYSLSRKMLMITDGEPEGLAREFINYILSSEGQKIVEDEGFIPIN